MSGVQRETTHPLAINLLHTSFRCNAKIWGKNLRLISKEWLWKVPRHQRWHIPLWKVCETETNLTERDFRDVKRLWANQLILKCNICVKILIKGKILKQTIIRKYVHDTLWHASTFVSHIAEANYLLGAPRTNRPVESRDPPLTNQARHTEVNQHICCGKSRVLYETQT